MISLSTGIIVTRAASEGDLGATYWLSCRSTAESMRTVAVVIFVLGVLPGLPKLPFLLVGVVLAPAMPLSDGCIFASQFGFMASYAFMAASYDCWSTYFRLRIGRKNGSACSASYGVQASAGDPDQAA